MITCAALAIALLAYTYAGYPLAIGLLARLFPGRRRAAPVEGGGDVDTDDAPTVSICLPVFNGSAYLPGKIRSLLEQDYPAHRIEILVYCDGCTDDSEAIARAIASSAEAGG